MKRIIVINFLKKECKKGNIVPSLFPAISFAAPF